MTENKLYAKCREEAKKHLIKNQAIYGNNLSAVQEPHETELSQLTAEIYGMKLLDMAQPLEMEKDYYLRRPDDGWFQTNVENVEYEIIGTTQDLHDHFVREFNKEVGHGN